jgi:cell filamentation protein
VPGRYDAVGPEAEFQPGSRGRVLRNRLAITSVRELERSESAALLIATQQIIDETRVDQRFTAGEIRRMHQLWLAEIYEWAGEYGKSTSLRERSCSRPQCKYRD